MKIYVHKKSKIILIILLVIILYLVLLNGNTKENNEEKYWFQAAHDKFFGLNSFNNKQKNKILRQEKPGELGKAVIISEDVRVNKTDMILKGWKLYGYNQYVSDLIGFHRTLPDPRDQWCTLPYQYELLLPKTSIIICFYNVGLSALLRTIHSILDNTPPYLYKEIILVDDFSELKDLQKRLEDLLTGEPNIRIIRNKKREGLLRARIIGTVHATADVLTFLDPNIEVTKGWLEPLLDRITINNTGVAFPLMDSINSETFKYESDSNLYVGGFNWNLQFMWRQVSAEWAKNGRHFAEPIRSPAMPGNIFSINKTFFERLGTYEEEFQASEEANLELSLKIWMCGGTLEVVPCSHVGIINKKCSYGYTFDNFGQRSLKRKIADFWLGDYKQYYYQRNTSPDVPIEDVSNGNKLRTKSGCLSFKWFLDNIYAEIFIPRNLKGFGLIGSDVFCLDSNARPTDVHLPAKVKGCVPKSYSSSQFWYYSQHNQIRKEEYCLHSEIINSNVFLYPCLNNSRMQEWDYQKNSKMFVHSLTGGCLKVKEKSKELEVVHCDWNEKLQQWFIKHFN